MSKPRTYVRSNKYNLALAPPRRTCSSKKYSTREYCLYLTAALNRLGLSGYAGNFSRNLFEERNGRGGGGQGYAYGGEVRGQTLFSPYDKI